MPLIGRYSFLLHMRSFWTACDCRCQCPQSGDTHFYGFPLRETLRPMWVCQCPQSGDTHFYLGGKCNENRWSKCVNALNRAILISTNWKFMYGNCRDGVNALNRAILISTAVMFLIRMRPLSLCQCPQSGDTHFYPASLEPAYLAAFRARFCRYFSEYSDY